VGRPPMDTTLSSTSLLTLTTAAVVNWLMWGATFATFTFSIVDLDPNKTLQLLLLLIVSYPIAYAVGFISFLTPSGFGVREGAFYVLLSPVMAGGLVAVAALAMRAFTALGELSIAVVSAPFERGLSAPHSQPDTVPYTQLEGVDAPPGFTDARKAESERSLP